jgi:hypothetical protein
MTDPLEPVDGLVLVVVPDTVAPPAPPEPPVPPLLALAWLDAAPVACVLVFAPPEPVSAGVELDPHAAASAHARVAAPATRLLR